MNKPKGIDATQAHEKAKAGTATLVCAYDQEEKCQALLLDGAITMSRLRETLDRHSKDEEVILYCASPNEATSARVADELSAQGFTNARFLIGGVNAWKKSGFPLAAEVVEQHPPP